MEQGLIPVKVGDGSGVGSGGDLPQAGEALGNLAGFSEDGQVCHDPSSHSLLLLLLSCFSRVRLCATP